MQPDAKYDPCVLRLIPIGLGHGLLELDGRVERIDSAGKLDQGTVAGQLDQAAAVAGQYRFQALFSVFPQARDGATFVPPHQAGIADHVGCNDCC